ncbi:hypothetical protein QFC19_005797 [Naganishia cerealis]|uniref:Uncharacterized protein n=2 Tax=Naganishia cerealis TaxID=610337 RepID=A0ACC2V0V6_9TREE|nr:hypothetical protein QFC19_008563 [Naganishia cerealis]KAJ9099980.1 hypothetical protein QFC19_005797 [Naganishia cerealis]
MDSDTPPIGPGVPPRGSGFSPAPQLQEQLQGLLPQTLGLQDHVVPAVDTEARGLKRKLAGWTAPGDHPTVQQDSKAGIDPSVPVLYDADVKPSVLDVALPQSMVKSEQSPPPLTSSDLPAPVEQQPTIRYARLGTRLPGSGDLGGPGIQKRVWPRLSGVHLDVVWKGQAPEPAVNGNDGPSGTKNQGQDDEVVLEEECYSWTDLPMNKQGKSSCFPIHRHAHTDIPDVDSPCLIQASDIYRVAHLQ